MNILFILAPAAVLLGSVFLFYFLWASRSGQFDDLDTPALKMLNDDDDTKTKRFSATRGDRNER